MGRIVTLIPAAAHCSFSTCAHWTSSWFEATILNSGTAIPVCPASASSCLACAMSCV